MDVLILADGDAPTRVALDDAWPGWDADVGLVVAADGGARHASTLGVVIDFWVGDGDSVDGDDLAALAAAGVPIERSRPDKDESDTELALLAALRHDPDGVIIVGAMGGPRLDHALANIGLLAHPGLATRRAVILDARSRVTLVRAPTADGGPSTTALVGRPGDLVTLLPAGPGVDGVTTRGLAYTLEDEPLVEGTTRGLSNVVASVSAGVTVRRGWLLVIESPATLRS